MGRSCFIRSILYEAPNVVAEHLVQVIILVRRVVAFLPSFRRSRVIIQLKGPLKLKESGVVQAGGDMSIIGSRVSIQMILKLLR